MPAVMLLESQCHLSLLLSLPEALMDDHAFSFLARTLAILPIRHSVAAQQV